jgi:4'-phosphopantetheinyl transferase EntD
MEKGSIIPVLSLRSLFMCEVAVACAVPREVEDELYPDERTHVANAVAKRRAEFGTARVTARRVLGELGFPPLSLVPDRDRSPRWPEGVVGTISHCDGLCAVAVARSSVAAGIGLDVECASGLDRTLEATICTETEQMWLESSSPGERRHRAKLLFSAKEAFYKCQFPTTHTFLDYKEVDIRVGVDDNRFTILRVHRSGPTWRALETAQGRFLRTHDFVVTAATLPSPASTSEVR